MQLEINKKVQDSAIYKEKIGLVIPCFKVRKHIMDVISKVGPQISFIYIVDDFCPEQSGKHVEENNIDTRVRVIFNHVNKGVGGATIDGYRCAIADECTIVVKIDGDDQMDLEYLSNFIEPIIYGEADYTKGNRFFNIESLLSMPKIRVCGNAILSFMNKISSGYWNIFDPTNGYTAIDVSVLKKLPLEKISKRYFFESDMLFRLNTIRSVVLDVPINSKYGNEISNLKISRIIFEFLYMHILNTYKRIFYNYYLRDMSIASMQLPLGFIMFTFGFSVGLASWFRSWSTASPAHLGSVMLSAVLILLGSQLILAFLAYDIMTVPKKTISNRSKGFYQI